MFSLGRQALYFALKALEIGPGDSVLVPSFICDSATSPILQAGARVAFYRIKKDCSIDFADIEKRISSETRALLAVHFFGLPCDIPECRRLCDQFGLFLIEDCAHLLEGQLGGKRLGTFGDAAIFSWRKSLPLEDGGELFLNSGHPFDASVWQRENSKEGIRKIWHLAEQLLGPIASAVSRSIHDARQPTSTKGAIRAEGNGTTETKPSVSVKMAMSPVSRFLLKHLNISCAAKMRRENYRYLAAKLAGMAGVHLLRVTLPDGACPMLFPLILDGYPQAHLALRAMGIPAVTWGEVIPPGLNLQDFPESAFLYDNLVLLPVHQSLRQRDLDDIATAVAAIRADRAAIRNVPPSMQAAVSKALT
jgi:perosamine synthetase